MTFRGVIRRNFSTSNSNTESPTPIIIFTIKNLDNKASTGPSGKMLRNKGGIYSFINTVNGNQYIGSAKDLYLRLNEHLDNRKSNVALQRAIEKYGLNKFNFCVYEYFTYESKIISSKALAGLGN